MEIPDSREQVKIWQRTRNTQPPASDGLQMLAAGALRTANAYGTLAYQVMGVQKEQMKQLREQQLSAVRCLKGIYRLATGQTMKVQVNASAEQNIEPALRQIYGQSLKACNAYESRSGDSEYGAVFEMLAAREREHCRKIAEIMGALQV